MRVGVLDVLTTPALGWSDAAYHLVITKQYASIMPQAIAVWCRELGHRTHYASYYGLGDPLRLLPDDLDVVFIATYTQASALAYALAKLYRRDGATTVVGGPHAKAFPHDCLRFFDVVVGDCDKTLVADVLRGTFPPGSIVTSGRPLIDLPTVEERMPELRRSAFARGRPTPATTIPLLASTGCPYACEFCIDAATPYRVLPLDRLAADLQFVAATLPGTMIGFHDPNFAVKFDTVMDTLEAVPRERRSPYIVESSLSVLRADRLRRLGETNCASMAPGVESWTDYASKAGSGPATGREKVARVVERFTTLHEHVPYLQANFLFGLDDDAGDEPIALMKEFMSRTPFVWPVVNIPHPFGGTPLFSRYRADGRILATMPFAFYYSPYLVTTLRHYTTAEFYRRMIEVYEHFTAPSLFLRRLRSTASPFVGVIHTVRTAVKRRRIRAFRRLLALFANDAGFRAFHDATSAALPEFYDAEYERMLGRFAPLMTHADRRPVLGEPSCHA